MSETHRAVDGETPLDDTSGLLAPITTREELDAVEFEGVTRATTKYLLRTPSDHTAMFTMAWLLRVHHEMFARVWTWAGQIRRSNKNVGVDKSQIREQLKLFEQDYRHWLQAALDPEELTARVHHRLVWIHPFENGNGRWARLVTNIHCKKYGQALIQWPESTLIERSNLREKYLKALRAADGQDFRALVAFHRSLARR